MPNLKNLQSTVIKQKSSFHFETLSRQRSLQISMAYKRITKESNCSFPNWNNFALNPFTDNFSVT